MSTRVKSENKTRVVTQNPLDGEQLLLDAVFGEGRNRRGAAAGNEEPASLPPERPVARARKARPTVKPDHYKIVSISLYKEDIERLNDMVRELKRRGHYKANKSQLIRYALARLDLDEIPREY